MVKTTKRARKFSAKGGPRGMLQKGTITKKGKLKMRKKGQQQQSGDGAGNAHTNEAMELRREMNKLRGEKVKREAEDKRKKDDFVGESNLGDLDLDSFLQNVADDNDNGGKDGDNNDGGDDGDVDVVDDDESMEGEESDSDSEQGSDDDEDDDEDDEDVEAAEKRMKEEMQKLAESDPDFHKYLQNNEASLLDFQTVDMVGGEGNDNAGVAMDVDDTDGGEGATNKKDGNVIIVNAKLLKSYETGAFESHGIKALRKIVAAYTSACRMADSDANGNAESNDETSLEAGSGGKKNFHIESSTVFDKLMVTCLTKCHEEFHYHLLGKGSFPNDDKDDDNNNDKDDNDSDDSDDKETINIDPNKPINPKHLTRSIRWPQLKYSIQSFLKSTLHLISEAKETKLLRFILKSFSHYTPYLSAFPRLAKAALKTFTSTWSNTTDSSPDYQSVRLGAFLRMRQLALVMPFPFIEQCLKISYLSYAKSAKFANAATVSSLLPTLTFMGNCVVELYSLDYASSYQHAFIYIRQLALHLRSALQKKSPESFRVVYCWQFMHCLKLWTAVLAATCTSASGNGDKALAMTEEEGGTGTSTSTSTSSTRNDDDDEVALMQSLIYPLVEIIFGVARLIPTARHLPLRLHCVRYLQQLAAASEQFIPTTSILLDVFDLREVSSLVPKRGGGRGKGGKGNKSDVRGVRLVLILKFPKVDALRTSEQLDASLGEVFLLLNREVDLYRYSAGFPEFGIRICQRLRKFAKVTKNGKFRAYTKGCIELCEKHSRAAILSRSKLEEAPKDIKRIEVLKPNNVPSMGERYEMAIAKEKRLEVAEQPVVSEAAKRRARDVERKVKVEQEERERKRAAVEERKAKMQKSKKQKVQVNEEDLKNVDALKEEDEIEEGIDWSESESESDSE